MATEDVAEGSKMLEYKASVKVPGDDKAAVNVFCDDEKGHTIYLSHSGTMVVVENDKSKNNQKTKAAGFSVAADTCNSCNGC